MITHRTKRSSEVLKSWDCMLNGSSCSDIRKQLSNSKYRFRKFVGFHGICWISSSREIPCSGHICCWDILARPLVERKTNTFGIDRNTVYVTNHCAFGNCQRSLAAVTTVKHESDLKDRMVTLWNKQFIKIIKQHKTYQKTRQHRKPYTFFQYNRILRCPSLMD